ncbi:MAG TPA: plastocyanin/azurin family copper-binding protein [Candidatus Limnocylindria bacterium]|nr:plastocyanin/azurin family copper-binding protein [Candidatus Limnocylindria bacterium]
MRSNDRGLPGPPMLLPVLLASLLLILAACTAETAGESVEATTAESATESMASSEASTEESAEASEAGSDTVALVNFQFDPTELNVAAGTTVTFVNEDDAAHTVTEGENGAAAEDARFDEEVAGGDSVEVTFEEAGDYNVTCRFHGQMNMVVHVE